jgi:mono/diheme cytochrome c family protein
MRPYTRGIVFVVCLSALAAAALVACSSFSTSGGSSSNGGSSGGGMMGGGGASASAYSSAGERIYLTGVGSDGQDIPRTAPRVSQGALMMGGGGCGSCHAADGRGGTIRMMTGTAIKAPDVTYGALIKAGFTDTTIATAIRDGLDESGKPLDAAMPRWHMSDADLAATIAYLNVLDAR